MKWVRIFSFIVCFCFTICYMSLARASVASNVWGTVGPNSIYGGMWTYHLNADSNRKDNSNNWLIAGVYKGFFAGTFIDSFSHRNYLAGIQRYWYQKPLKHDFEYYLGYRLGLVYGYDERFMDIATKTPVLPFAQLMTSLTWKNLGWEINYTGVIISTTFYIKFG